jgi:hypothetical protein
VSILWRSYSLQNPSTSSKTCERFLTYHTLILYYGLKSRYTAATIDAKNMKSKNSEMSFRFRAYLIAKPPPSVSYRAL